MDWWLWILLGLALFGLEMLTPGGFYVFFFAIGAIVAGMLSAVGAGGSTAAQWLVFSIVSVASLVLFRARLLRAFAPSPGAANVDSLLREIAVIQQDLPANGVGKVELRGTLWSARNVGDRELRAGERCRIDRVDGLMLWVRAE